eukprot:scaffold176178_cov64-Cyclotella_meneghiniana.AAC.1
MKGCCHCRFLRNLTKGTVKGIGSRIVVLCVYWICLIHCHQCLDSPQLARKRVVNQMCLLRTSVVGRGEFCSLREM